MFFVVSKTLRCSIIRCLLILINLNAIFTRTSKPHPLTFGRRKPNNIQCYGNGDCLSDCCISSDGVQGTCVGRPLVGQICGLFGSSPAVNGNQNQWKSSRDAGWYIGASQGFHSLLPYDDSSQSHATDASPNFPTEPNRYEGSLGAASQLTRQLGESSPFWNTHGQYNRAGILPSYISASSYRQQPNGQQAGSGGSLHQESSVRYSPQSRAISAYDFTSQNPFVSQHGGFEYPSNIESAISYGSDTFM